MKHANAIGGNGRGRAGSLLSKRRVQRFCLSLGNRSVAHYHSPEGFGEGVPAKSDKGLVLPDLGCMSEVQGLPTIASTGIAPRRRGTAAQAPMAVVRR